jgi:uncharacterized membrane protein
MGFILMFAGFATLFLAFPLKEGVTGGGAFVIFIGPFPLAVGFGECAPILILISVIIVAVMILITLLSFKCSRTKPDKS